VAIQEDVEDVQIMVQGVPHLFSLVLQDDELQDATSCLVLATMACLVGTVMAVYEL
jgi:hypothetical protein